MLERLGATRGMEDIEYEESAESTDSHAQKKVCGRTLELLNSPDADIQVEQNNNKEKRENRYVKYVHNSEGKAYITVVFLNVHYGRLSIFIRLEFIPQQFRMTPVF